MRSGASEPVLIMINDQKFVKTADSRGRDKNAKGTNTNQLVVFGKPQAVPSGSTEPVSGLSDGASPESMAIIARAFPLFAVRHGAATVLVEFTGPRGYERQRAECSCDGVESTRTRCEHVRFVREATLEEQATG